MSTDCITSSTIEQKITDKETVRIQTASDAVYEGIIESADCLGVVFIPSTHTKYNPAYIMYGDIKKIMLPEHGGIK
jgi:hypothetical protein